MDPTLQRTVRRLPPIDERARQNNLAMTNANFVFIGDEVSWPARPASATSIVWRCQLAPSCG